MPWISSLGPAWAPASERVQTAPALACLVCVVGLAFHLGGRVLAFLELKTSASGSRRRGRAGGLGSTHLPALEDPPLAHGRVLAVSGARRSGAPWLLILLVGQEVVVAVPMLGPSQVLSSEQLGWKGQDAGLLQVVRGPSPGREAPSC